MPCSCKGQKKAAENVQKAQIVQEKRLAIKEQQARNQALANARK